MILSLMFSFAMAGELPGETLFQSTPSIVKQDPKLSNPQAKPARFFPTGGNLPSEIVAHQERTESMSSELILPVKTSAELFRGLKVGEEIKAFVNHSIIAFPDEKAPVVAELSGPSVSRSRHFRGWRLIGESSLEPNSKRIFVNFSRLVVGDQIYQIEAQALSDEGQVGLNCEYHSQESKYFAGDFVASAVAGYFDGLVPRTTNPYGQVVEDNSVDSAFKKGMSGGAMSTAERLKKKLEKVPEYGEVTGPIELKILILSSATSDGR